ncbi:MAG: hypothetical protein K9N11_01275 [Lentisphaeria bacterium]|nr:hypothetical protein [Candidatus Neomarinimicrobiota bacterium]MCF7841459.1 hypothetical protein [Lentisphaeria bacterium]
MSDIKRFAQAIALRISDEWSGKHDFPDDAKLLKSVLETLLENNPDQCMLLIGTGIIEENYLDSL